MKRFYKEVKISAPTHNGLGVLLDGKSIKTPGGMRLELPTSALAQAVADEWRMQTDSIDLQSMPLTKLAYAALDVVAQDFDRAAGEALAYGKSDLVSYRAEAPRELVERESATWDPLVLWMEKKFGTKFVVAQGIGFVEQPPDTLAALEHGVWQHDAFTMAGLLAATKTTGSLAIALALLAARIDAAQAFEAAHVDEHFQSEQWGHDEAAEERRARLKSELEAVERFLRLISPRPL